MKNIVPRYKFVILYFLCILLATWVGYGGISYAYFQSDEWLYINGVKAEGIFFVLNKTSWPDLLAGFHRPLGVLTGNFLYKTFTYTPGPFLVVGIVLHLLNCLLLYGVAKKLTGSTFVAFAAGLFFATSGAYAQTLTWLMPIVQVPASTFFTLLAIYVVSPLPWVSLVFAYIAFLFKDAAIYLFFALPFLGKKRSIVFSLAAIGLGILFTTAKIRGFGAGRLEPWDSVGELFSGADSYVQVAYRILIYPLIGLSWMLIPVCFALLKNRRVFFGVIITYILSLVPVAIYATYLPAVTPPSRFLYFPTMLTGIMVAYAIRTIRRPIVFWGCILFLLIQLFITRAAVAHEILGQQFMKNIATQLTDMHVAIPESAALFVTSDTTPVDPRVAYVLQRFYSHSIVYSRDDAAMLPRDQIVGFFWDSRTQKLRSVPSPASPAGR